MKMVHAILKIIGMQKKR